LTFGDKLRSDLDSGFNKSGIHFFPRDSHHGTC
jgi:hypothetical protein